jgi:lipid II:glycine glycyltransferase (peptidoglycan interpeptide bridge formation enzyme)
MFTIKEVKNNHEVEAFLISLNAPFTQGMDYANWQIRREVRQFIVEKDGQITAFFQAIKYPLIFGKSYYYIPYGPVVREYSADLLDFLQKSLDVLRSKDVVFVRSDFFPKTENENVLECIKRNFYKVPALLSNGSSFQPRQEWFLNIEKDQEILLAEMNKKTRYAIRFAEKGGVKVKIIDHDFSDYFSDFYKLMQITAKRGNFGLHPERYYRNIFSNLDKSNINKSFLSIATFEDKIQAIDLIVVLGTVATYVFGGSSNDHRNLSPAYLAQWASIIQAKVLSCKEYNFGGVSVGGEKQKKEWAAFTDYKIKFGGRAVTHSGYYDIIWGHFWYFIYSARKLFKRH